MEPCDWFALRALQADQSEKLGNRQRAEASFVLVERDPAVKDLRGHAVETRWEKAGALVVRRQEHSTTHRGSYYVVRLSAHVLN